MSLTLIVLLSLTAFFIVNGTVLLFLKGSARVRDRIDELLRKKDGL